MVGPEIVFQQIPFSVTAAPPSSAMSPPVVTEIAVTELAWVVVTVGETGGIGGGQPVIIKDNTTKTNKERILKLTFFGMAMVFKLKV